MLGATDAATITRAAGASTVTNFLNLTRSTDAADNGVELAFKQSGAANTLSWIRSVRQGASAKDKLSFGVSANWGTTAPTEYMALDSTGLAVTGAGTFTGSLSAGAISGTTGLFTGAITMATDSIVTASAANANLALNSVGGSGRQWVIGSLTDGNLRIRDATGSANLFIFSTTGLSVTGTLSATDTISTTKTGLTFFASGGTTSAKYACIQNTGGSAYYGIEASTGGGILTGTTAYAMVIGHSGNYPLEFGMNNAKYMTLTANQLVVGSLGRTFIRQNGTGDTEIGGVAGSNYTAFFVNGNEYSRLTSTGLAVTGNLTVTNGLSITGSPNGYDAFTINQSSSNSIGLRIQNSYAGSNNWNISSSGGGPTANGSFCVYDDTAGATALAITKTNRYLVVPGVYNQTSASAPNVYVDSNGNIMRSTASIGSGTVTSVAISGNNGIGVSGSPITTNGTITLSLGAITPSSVTIGGNAVGSNAYRALTISTSTPSGGSDGDVWYQY
jgi:hypothetical protein